MFLIIGWVVVTVSVLGGYMAMGGKLGPLWQPFELVIIGGAGVGAFVVANPKYVLAKAGYGFKTALKGPKYNKEDYLELLSLLYAIFKLAKTKGMLAIEAHIERPALDLVEVVGMHRLAEFEDDVVGDVDDRADAALPGTPQTLAQPERRWPGVIDIDEDTVVEPRTGRPGGERDRRRLLCRRARRGALDGRRDRLAVRAAEGSTGERGDLAREALDGHRIAAVRRDRELEQRIIEVEDRTKISPQSEIRRKLEDAV